MHNPSTGMSTATLDTREVLARASTATRAPSGKTATKMSATTLTTPAATSSTAKMSSATMSPPTIPAAKTAIAKPAIAKPATAKPATTTTHPEQTEKIRRDPADIVGQYVEDYLEHGRTGVSYVLRHPRQSVEALAAIAALPVLPVSPSASVEGELIRNSLTRTEGLGRLPLLRETVDLLRIPADPADYEQGADKQTLRRKVRYARKAGVTWSEVTDAAERRELLKLADFHERIHPDEQYRGVPENDDMLDYRLWLVAYAEDGRPLMLSVTPYDGEWGLLRHFRTLGTGREYSDTRYLMTQVLVEQLSKRGVRYLTNHAVPFDLPKGLRHFQKMVGWQIGRVHLARR